VASNLAAFAAIKRQDFDPRAEVVIEEPGPDRPSGPWGSAQATIVAESANRLVVETVGTQPAWLVLNDMYGPGWTATVDGKPIPVFRANALVRAVPVDGGQQRVEWKYTPASVRVGAWISITALLFALALVLFPKPSAPGGRAPAPSLP
jgi:Bacterial membrane protein YfhO